MADSAWRQRLRPASFRGERFNVEVGARAGGRRLAPHEYPKRDEPYLEDMGRKARVFPVTAYCIGPDYQFDRDALILALETEGVGTLVHPTFGEFQVKIGPYSCVERREAGGYCEIEFTAFEAGIEQAFTIEAVTQDQVRSGADAAQSDLTASGNAVADQKAVEQAALDRALAAGA